MPSTMKVEELTVGYGDNIVLKDMSFSLEGPGIVQVLGPNGAGKTTLLRTLLGLIKPLYGRVYINGEDVTGCPEKAGGYVGYVPQLLMADKQVFPLTAWEVVENSLLLHKKKWPRLYTTVSYMEKIKNVLEQVGLPRDSWFKSFWKLSGGQRQRVLIARALVHNPDILVMDEPFSSVDPTGRAELVELIANLSREKLVIVSSHDPMLLLKYTRKVILMNRGLYIIGAPDEVLTLENTRKIYGAAAIPVKEHIHICDTHIY